MFVAETSKVNGEPYSPKTLYELLCGLLRHARSEDPGFPNFLDKSDVRFIKLHNIMDSVFRKLRTDGVGSEKKNQLILSQRKRSPNFGKVVS